MWARLLFLTATTAIAMAAQATLSPSRLRCEYLADPIGIQELAPRLSWVLTSPERNQVQTAYRIRAASTLEKLKTGDLDVWDSGQITSDESAHVEYKGKTLKSGERVWWAVTVWDKNGAANASKSSYFEMGLLSPGDWHAKWIGRPDKPRPQIDLSASKWIWFPEGNPAKDAPTGNRFFRTKFDIAALPSRATIAIAVDDRFSLKINGREIGSGHGTSEFSEFDIAFALNKGTNIIEATGNNGQGRAGILISGLVETPNGSIPLASNRGWESSIDGKDWQPSMELDDANGTIFEHTRFIHAAGPSPILRKSFEVEKKIKRARLYASAKGLYYFEIDGKRLGADIFTPGWTDYTKRIQYQTYDVTNLLAAGSHRLQIVLGDGWYCGHVGLSGRENYGPKPMGLCQLEIEYTDGTSSRIATDESWQVGSGPILLNDLLMGETYDARIAPSDWTSAEVDPTPPANLVAQRSETVQKLTELKPKKITEPKPGHYVFDLGQNMVGWARLRVQGKAGQTVTLRFAEMLNPDGTIYTTNLRGAKCTDYYTLSGKGAETFEPTFTFHGFRYVELTGYPGKPGSDAVTGVVVGSDVAQTGSFLCSNTMVNKLQHNIFWGQRGNYLEVPTDCPQRDERLGWMGDAQIFARTACFNNDIAAFMTKWTQDVEDAQSEPGGFSDVTPRIGDLSDGAPAWGDAGVIVPWTMYLCYGDTRLLERRYDSMKRWIDYIDSANPNHIWVNRSNNNFGDWLNVHDDTPREVLATAYFAHSTDIFARVATILGHTDDAAKYAALRESIKKAFNEHFVAVDGVIAGNTQTSYVLALWFGLLPPDQIRKASALLVNHIVVDRKNHLSTGFVGVGYLCPTLTSIDAVDVAYKLLQNDTYPSWGYSIKQGATTIWERWDGWTEDKGFQDPGMNSFNHYSLGSVGEWMYARVAGIDLDPASPGYKHILIHPLPGGGITWAKGSYDSIRGKIQSSWKVEDGEIHLDVKIPANTTATVQIPSIYPSSLRVDGKPLREAHDVKAGEERPGFVTVEVGSGNYSFVVSN